MNKWIDYKKERPENGVCVLLLMKNLVMTTGYIKIDWPKFTTTIFVDNSNLIHEEIEITHWMKLPELPQ